MAQERTTKGEAFLKKPAVLALFFSLFLNNCLSQAPERNAISMEELVISVPAGGSREIAYTNKQAGVFYTETNGRHRSPWQGWRIMSAEIMKSYALTVNSVRLKAADARAEVFPDQLTRIYPSGIREKVTLLDSVDALVVELENIPAGELSVFPLFAASTPPDAYVTKFENNVLLFSRKDHPRRTGQENYPVWTGVMIAPPGGTSKVKQVPDTMEECLSVAALMSVSRSNKAAIIFTSGDTKEEAVSLAREVSLKYPDLIFKRKERMVRLLNSSYFRTDNPRFDKALNWAKISADALIMNQLKKGIFAGLPWFDNYWGRDTYISLPGAALVSGDFSDAKEILRSFAAWQDTDASSPNYGRIPNLVTTASISYNTADGTPRFVLALDEYLRYSDDKGFIKEAYPVIRRSIEGTLMYHTDSLFFLTHGDAETWMDAVGPEGPWSPRGSRANDIQALWARQLEIGLKWAHYIKDSSSEARWKDVWRKLIGSFQAYFVDSSNSLIYDHLKADGTPDTSFRPNQLFACCMPGLDRIEATLFRNVTGKLVYPYGVASLWQHDVNFHPYHHYQPFYVQDAAYHNGIVWTWLAGVWIDLACKYALSDLAFKVTGDMERQILDRGAVGTLSELLDAAPRPGENEPRLSGTFSQAWSLAEFIRNFYQSYLGITVDAFSDSVNIRPSLPSDIGAAWFTIAAGSSEIEAAYSRTPRGVRLSLSHLRGAVNLKIGVSYRPRAGKWPGAVIDLRPSSSAELDLGEKGIIPVVMKNAGIISSDSSEPHFNDEVFKGISLAKPFVRGDLAALKSPQHRMLSNSEVKRRNISADTLYDISDPEGDDHGVSGNYSYPLTSNLLPGSLDITRFTLLGDERNAYFILKFRRLSNPGWHPEYGFQLTYAAIAIYDGSPRESCQNRLGMNANYTFKDGFVFGKVIYVGGGLRISGAGGRVQAEYIPAESDSKNPLGNSEIGTIEFSLPLDIIGHPGKSWRYAVLIGCQDDHGGAGLGEFRSIEPLAKEWAGGGRNNPEDPNVYDLILPAPVSHPK